ncbi:MAG: chemotaxis protein CheA [Armatimonadota bacterium]
MSDFRDDPALREVFWQEAEEQLMWLEQGLMKIERDGQSSEVLNDVFRAAHTLKGSSGMMGFTALAELTHAMEELLDLLRQGRRSVDTDVANALLSSNDCLRAMLEALKTGSEHQPDAAPAILALKQVSISDSTGIQPGSAPSATASLPPLMDGAVRICATIAEDCLTPTIRAFMVFNALKDKSVIIASLPDESATESVYAGQTITVDILPQTSIDELLHSLNFSEVKVTLVEDRLQVEETSITTPEVAHHDEAGDTDHTPVEIATGREVGQTESTHFRGLQTVRVAVERLDTLMNLVGELVVGRSRIEQLVNELKQSVGESSVINEIRDTSVSLGQFTADLQEQIMRIRMLPVEQVFNRFPRMVRDLSHHAGKRVNFVITGQDTELDRSLMEDIVDPITHLLRNAIDHGVEMPNQRVAKGKNPEATVTLSAKHEENHILISVSDDGNGISVEHVRQAAVSRGIITPEAADRLTESEAMSLIFLPSVTTATEVTDISGRGVGMDVVKSNIERLGGSVDVQSQPGNGSTIIIRLPLTLAIVQALLVRAGDTIFAIPLSAIVETSRCDTSMLTTIEGRSVLPFRGNVLPVARLGDLLHIPAAANTRNHSLLVIVKTSGQQLGLIVDGLLGSHEIVIKPLGSFFHSLTSISGATLLGDGRIALVLDMGTLHQLVESSFEGQSINTRQG